MNQFKLEEAPQQADSKALAATRLDAPVSSNGTSIDQVKSTVEISSSVQRTQSPNENEQKKQTDELLGGELEADKNEDEKGIVIISHRRIESRLLIYLFTLIRK